MSVMADAAVRVPRSERRGETGDAWAARGRAALQPPIDRLVARTIALGLRLDDPAAEMVSGDLRAITEAGARLAAELGRCLAQLSGGARDEATIGRLRHDLRTPLNAIRGYAELLLEEDGNDRFELRDLLVSSEQVLDAIAAILTTQDGDGQALEPPEVRPAPVAAAAGETAPAHPVLSQSAPGRILIADDNQANRDLLTRRLMREGHEVTAVADGLLALDRLNSEAFDLVLLDFEMPGLPGVGVLERIKDDPRLAAIPVVMISAGTEVGRIVACLERGAEDYITKPFDPVVLRARIGACLEKKRLREREYSSWEQRLQAIMDMMVDGFAILDEDGRIQTVNPIGEQIFGAEAGLLRGVAFESLLGGGTPWRPDSWLERRGGRDGQTADAAREVVGRRLDGTTFPMDLSLMPLKDTARRLFGAMVRDISARKAAEARTAHLARHDSITDLPNETRFTETLEALLEGVSSATPGRPAPGADGAPVASVLDLTFANYKEVSSFMGQGIGPALLRAIADRLRPLMGPDDLLARLNGDEFAVLHPMGASPPEHLAEAMIDALTRDFMINGAPIELDPHIGIALIPNHGTTAVEVMRRVDIARERARVQTDRPYCRFEEQMWTAIRVRRTLERELRGALAGGEFVLQYQPKIQLATLKPAGAEVLIRWNHPIRGPIPPGQFIPAAEASGLIVGMGDWVVREVCRQIAEWRQDGLDGLQIAVNVSANHLRRGDLPALLREATAETGIDPAALEFEVTESVFLDEADGARNQLLALREAGAKVSIDDFGTGYSSLSYLHLLPVDKLKIDQSFVRRIAEDRTSQATTRAIIMLAKSMDLVAVAEGVESPEQAGFLIENQCDQAQGYLYSRPLDAAQFRDFMLATRRR
jgi:PAS domain S-box-containing protein